MRKRGRASFPSLDKEGRQVSRYQSRRGGRSLGCTAVAGGADMLVVKGDMTARGRKAGVPVWAAALAVLGLAGICLGQASKSAAPSARRATKAQTNWNQFHFTAGGTRFNPYEHVLNVKNVGRLRQKWHYYAGLEVESSPAVVGGVVYIGCGVQVCALNASTGAKVWSFTTGSGVDSSPAVADGIVYVGSNDGNLYAVDAGTGVKLWSFAAGYMQYSSPAVANGVVYVGQWFGNGDLYALDAKTGSELWSYPTGGGFVSTPTVVGGVAYFGSAGSNDHNVYALDASTGVELWSSAPGGNPLSPPTVANGVVYVGSDDFSVYALDAKTGTKLWSFATDSVASAPAVAYGLVYVGSYDSNVYAVDARTGTTVWSFHSGRPFQSSPAVANGVVYVGSEDNLPLCTERHDRRQALELRLRGRRKLLACGHQRARLRRFA